MKKFPISGFLISGGKSSRMGQDKGFVRYKDIPLAQHSLKILDKFCSKIFINTNNSAYEQFGYETIADNYCNAGPLGGILTCLEHTITDVNLILPVDTPHVNAGLIAHLLKFVNEYDIVIPVHNKYMEPLIGFYSRSIHQELLNFLQVKQFKLIDALQKVNTKFVNIDESLNFYDESLFHNVNTSSDLK